MGENFVISFGYYKTQSNRFFDRMLTHLQQFPNSRNFGMGERK